jgi:thiamine biosynthesis lipoprotein ApbE
MDVGDEEMERVRPEVHGRDAHDRRVTVDTVTRCKTRASAAMGTAVTVLLLDAPPDAAARAAAELERLEAKWSRFRPTSELCALDAAAPNAVMVSPET